MRAISSIAIILTAATLLIQYMAASQFLQLNQKEDLASIAFVSGYIGTDPAFVPALPHPIYDCYFITNNMGLGEFAAKSNWNVIYLDNIPVVDSSESIENDVINSAQSKPIKIHPERFLPKGYDYIVWFDNKFQLLVNVILSSISQWDSAVAMVLPPRPECCGADLEFKAAMLQPRYISQKERLEMYINEQVDLGFPVHGERHMRTGFIIYNMNHPETRVIQDMWEEHIGRAGIMCQIAFYFVAQRFPMSVQQYTLDWHTGGRYVPLVIPAHEDST